MQRLINFFTLWTQIGLALALMLAMTASLIIVIAVAPQLNREHPHFLQDDIVRPVQKSLLAETKDPDVMEIEISWQWREVPRGPVFVPYNPADRISWTDRHDYRWAFGFEDIQRTKIHAQFYIGRELTAQEIELIDEAVDKGLANKWRGVGPISGTTMEVGFEINHQGGVSWMDPDRFIDLPVDPIPFNTEIIVYTEYPDGRTTWMRFVLVHQDGGKMYTIDPTPAWNGPAQ